MDDKEFMKIAIEEAKKSDYPFGALIVKEGKIISKAGIINGDDFDPTSHAEMTVIKEACKKLKSDKLTNTILYTTCEPCPMCFTAAWLAGIGKIVWGMSLRDSSNLGYPEIEVSSEYLNEKGNNRILIVKDVMKEEIIKLFRNRNEI